MEVPNFTLTLLSIALSFVLVFLNAFFVASEFAIVKVRRTRLKELEGQGVAVARISIMCVDRLDEYLSATQLGITLVSLALGWIGEESFFNLFAFLFPDRLATGLSHGIAAGVSFFIITLLHVVLGELVPKSMAIQQAEKITLFVTPPLHWFYRLAKPLIHVFTLLANSILHLIGYHAVKETPLSEEELKLVMKDSKEDGVISESEAQIIHQAFSFSDKRAIDIMIPLERVQYLALNRTFQENMALAQTKMHTRFPLTQDGMRSIVGVIHMKDVLHHFRGETESNQILEQVCRPALFIESGVRQDRLVKIFKERRAHLAIVQDSKTKANIGIVTTEDILEELVGEIVDEHGN